MIQTLILYIIIFILGTFLYRLKLTTYSSIVGFAVFKYQIHVSFKLKMKLKNPFTL